MSAVGADSGPRQTAAVWPLLSLAFGMQSVRSRPRRSGHTGQVSASEAPRAFRS